ncbi:hypothetical protein GM160_04570 [Guyparkeria halophila]|uniref:Uncharacterized protein n=1 Tax=Guyparkeria halophila TaxID=47960 RepID=A0A6I6D9P1_9GAMM|nr:hypothetical protein [Guyparkeria halophila]QGT78232.1 hypothetical protein GM160_04570 [Guyparkeria halophila]
MDSDWIKRTYFSDEQLQAADDYLREAGADLSLDRRTNAGRVGDFRLFVNNDSHSIHAYLGHTEDGDIAIIVPEASTTLKQAHLIPGDQVILHAGEDRFMGRLRQTFHGRRNDDPGTSFVMTIHPG